MRYEDLSENGKLAHRYGLMYDEDGEWTGLYPRLQALLADGGAQHDPA